MFRLHIIIFLLLLTSITDAQTYQVFKGDTINRRDKNGVKQGLWKHYYTNDTLLSESNFRNGKRTGSFKTYYKSGKIQSDLKFRNTGKTTEVSDAILYYENGLP